jgi:hypothetical protein
MDLLQKILVTLAAGALLALASLYFRHRRLCVVTRYFPYARLGQDDIAVEFLVLNRGHRTEEEITIELDPKRRYDLVAHSSNVVTLEGTSLLVGRLPRAEDVSAILLVSGGDFTNANILQVRSKEAKGKVFPGLEKTPQPPGHLLAAFLGLLFFISIFEFMAILILQQAHPGALPDLLKGEAARRARFVAAAGWTDASTYVRSTIAKCYALNEVPVSVRFLRKEGQMAVIEIAVTNHCAESLALQVSLEGATPTPAALANSAREFISDTEIKPSSASDDLLRFYAPKDSTNVVTLTWYLTTGSGDIASAKRVFNPGSLTPEHADQWFRSGQ